MTDKFKRIAKLQARKSAYTVGSISYPNYRPYDINRTRDWLADIYRIYPEELRQIPLDRPDLAYDLLYVTSTSSPLETHCGRLYEEQC